MVYLVTSQGFPFVFPFVFKTKKKAVSFIKKNLIGFMDSSEKHKYTNPKIKEANGSYTLFARKYVRGEATKISQKEIDGEIWYKKKVVYTKWDHYDAFFKTLSLLEVTFK